MTQGEANLECVRRYLKALEAGVTGEDLTGLFADDIVQIEFPNRLKPKGDRRDRAAMGADAKRGAKILERQSYEIRNALADGDRVAVEVRWEGVMAVPIGSLKPGDTMVVHSAMFFAFADGKIVSQHNFDCVEEF